jgi:hypothetical protein
MASPYDPNAGGQVPPPPGAYPGPAYPNSPHGQQYVPAERPGTLTAASVLAFVLSGWNIIGGIILMAGGAVVGAAEDAGEDLGVESEGIGGMIILMGLAFIVLGGVYIWGGVVSLSGKNAQVLTIVAGIDLVLSIVWIIVNQGLITLVSIAAAIIILAMVLTSSSRQFVRAKGGKTF